MSIDVSVVNGRIAATIDYYNKRTSDLLYYSNLPWATGYSSYLNNIGKLRNSGVELALNTMNFVGAFKWNSSLNVSINRNMVTDLNGSELYINNDTYKLKIGNWAVIREGEPMGSFYGLRADGIWQTAEAEVAAKYGAKPGDFKYVDKNNDGKINADDCEIIGHALPDFTWGFNNTFSFRNFTLDIFLQGSQGNQILNSNRFELESLTVSKLCKPLDRDSGKPEQCLSPGKQECRLPSHVGSVSGRRILRPDQDHYTVVRLTGESS